MKSSVLFVITMAFAAEYLHRHRKKGGHCTPHPSGGVENVEMKRPMQMTNDPRYYTEPVSASQVPPV
jgi:hypothetical protein